MFIELKEIIIKLIGAGSEGAHNNLNKKKTIK